MVVPRFLSVYSCDHTVQLRVASFVFVVHEREFEVRGVLVFLLRIGAFLELVDHIGASAVFSVELVRM